MPRANGTLTRILVAATFALPAITYAQPAGPPPTRGAPLGRAPERDEDGMRGSMRGGMQGGMQRPVQGPLRPGVSRLIDARRELDLTARQLVQLDSIERVQVAERRQQQERMVQWRDSLRRQAESERGLGRDSLRAIARARMEAERPRMEQARRRDSASMAAAERLLTEPQRQRLREMRAEERGRQRGLREAQVRGMRQGGERRMSPPAPPQQDRPRTRRPDGI